MKQIKKLLKQNPDEVYKIVALTMDMLRYSNDIQNDLNSIENQIGIQNYIHLSLYDKSGLKKALQIFEIENQISSEKIQIQKPSIN